MQLPDNVSDIPVLVLAGGMGTRLKSVLSDAPKPLAPVAGKPFLHWQIELLRSQGFKRFILLTGFRSEAIQTYFQDGSSLGVEIQYQQEHEPLGTGGAIKAAIINFPENRYLLLNGDSLLITDYRRFAQNASASIEIALSFQTELSRYGRVLTDADGTVTQFIEKSNNEGDGFINSGVYFLSGDFRSFFASQPEKFSFERDILEPRAFEGKVKSQICPGPFIDIGIPESLALAQSQIPKWTADETRPCLFLDRDGILVEHVNYLHKVEDTRLIAETIEMIRLARENRWHVVVCTNQSGVGRGLFSESDCNRIHSYIDERLWAEGLRIDRWYTCFFHPEKATGKWLRKSLLRKPSPGMVLKACEDLRVDIDKSLFVGDNLTDQIDLPQLKTWLIQDTYELASARTETRVFSDRRSALENFRKIVSTK